MQRQRDNRELIGENQGGVGSRELRKNGGHTERGKASRDERVGRRRKGRNGQEAKRRRCKEVNVATRRRDESGGGRAKFRSGEVMLGSVRRRGVIEKSIVRERIK